MSKLVCAATYKGAFRLMVTICAFAMGSLPVSADRINLKMLNNGRFQDHVRGHLDRSPEKGIRWLSPAQQAQAKANIAAAASSSPVRPPVYSFLQPSSRSGSMSYGFMVGTSPFAGENVHSSTVPTYVVPVVFKVHQVATDFGLDANNNVILTGIKDKEATFDPTKPSHACLGNHNNVPFTLAEQSPVFQNHHWEWGGTDLGNTQYVDAFQRANFWKALGDNAEDYHVRLGVHVLPPVVLDFPAGTGIGLPQSSSFFGYSACAPTVMVDFNYFDAVLDYFVIPSLAASGVNASALPVFIGGNVVWGAVIGELPIYNPEAAGYHSLSDLDASQNYAVTAFGDDNVFNWPDAMPLSHEIGEWMNDPNTANYVQLYTVGTPPNSYCQENYEVGDILAGTYMPLVTGANGYSYTLQELAFFSFFYGGPSLAVNGWYSNNNTLKTDAGPACSLF